MNAPVKIDTDKAGDLLIVRLFRSMSAETQMAALKLMLADFRYAQDEGDSFLDRAAWEYAEDIMDDEGRIHEAHREDVHLRIYDAFTDRATEGLIDAVRRAEERFAQLPARPDRIAARHGGIGGSRG